MQMVVPAATGWLQLLSASYNHTKYLLRMTLHLFALLPVSRCIF